MEKQRNYEAKKWGNKEMGKQINGKTIKWENN